MPERFDLVVIGSGPAGQKAAVQAAKAGRRVAVIEREQRLGGECVHHGTIPSKTLRASAGLMRVLQRAAGAFEVHVREGMALTSLMSGLDEVVDSHARTTHDQLSRNGVVRFHGVGRFAGPHTVEVVGIGGQVEQVHAERVVIATGSRPRKPAGVAIDHEHIYDSDSILSMTWLPRSLTVLGGGVIATEWASIFQRLGVVVTQVNRHALPLGFLDEELNQHWIDAFHAEGGRYLGDVEVEELRWDGAAEVVTRLADGRRVRSEKALVAYGRVAVLERLDLEAAGLTPNARGNLQVNAHLQTSVPHIYAAGDVAGPPGLASSAMEQGRRAACHAFGLGANAELGVLPCGIYTIPEIASVGLGEDEARAAHPDVVVGRARFRELARGQIADLDGLLKLVAAPDGRLLGVQIVGEGATELIHLGQMALVNQASAQVFVDTVFNFPTLAEAYRVAGLDVINQLQQRARRAA